MQINKETIEQLFRQHYLRMYQLARVLLKDDAASKDVVSEVFADVLDGKIQLGLDNETIASNSPLPSTNMGPHLCLRQCQTVHRGSGAHHPDHAGGTRPACGDGGSHRGLPRGVRYI